jgi:hypothetical protein
MRSATSAFFSEAVLTFPIVGTDVSTRKGGLDAASNCPAFICERGKGKEYKLGGG